MFSGVPGLYQDISRGPGWLSIAPGQTSVPVTVQTPLCPPVYMQICGWMRVDAGDGWWVGRCG